MNDLNELLDKYKAEFGKQFPLMLCRGITEEEICETIQNCLHDGKPYSPELDPDANY